MKFLTEGIVRIDKQIDKAPENLIFTGLLDLEQMPLVYNAADVLLFPSYQENSPLVPIEAAACGLPVVFRDLPEYRSLYEHDYLKAQSNEEFLLLVKHLMTDKRFYADAVVLSSNLVAQFDKDLIRRKLLDLYEQVLDRHSANSKHHTIHV